MRSGQFLHVTPPELCTIYDRSFVADMTRPHFGSEFGQMLSIHLFCQVEMELDNLCVCGRSLFEGFFLSFDCFQIWPIGV